MDEYDPDARELDDGRSALLRLLGMSLAAGGAAAVGLGDAVAGGGLIAQVSWAAFAVVVLAVVAAALVGLARRRRWAALRDGLRSRADERAHRERAPGQDRPTRAASLRARVDVELEAGELGLPTAEAFAELASGGGAAPGDGERMRRVAAALEGYEARTAEALRRSLRPWPLSALGRPLVFGGVPEEPGPAATRVTALRERVADLGRG